ncbi:Uncharacterized protein APZ42_031345 [Daphnia magna]|uniref:CCHC-type domain-containing protein n=1 Tax=Daphnia magna TaxID=35525 RepID=A0A164MX10_9CRUS|nr:Uncharacterized protein APZ42_031345 [Daphnia magna]
MEKKKNFCSVPSVYCRKSHNKKKAKNSKYTLSSSLEQLQENNEALKNSLEKANSRITDLEQSLETTLATENKLQNLLKRKETEGQKIINKFEGEKTKLIQKLNTAENQIKQVSETAEKLQKEIKLLADRLDKATTEKIYLKKTLHDFTSKNKNLEEEFQELQNRVRGQENQITFLESRMKEYKKFRVIFIETEESNDSRLYEDELEEITKLVGHPLVYILLFVFLCLFCFLSRRIDSGEITLTFVLLVELTDFRPSFCVRLPGRFITTLATRLVHDATTRGAVSPPCMNEPIDVFDGDCFIGWLWDSTMAVANARPFRPYGTPPPFDMDDYKDSFEIWQAQWEIFLELSTIDTALNAAEPPRYKANVLKSCMSKSTLTALLTSGMSAADLQDPAAIITALKDRCNAGHNCHVWRQQFSSRVQRDKEAIDDWLCNLRSISSNCEFGTDCCDACEPTRILGQLVLGVHSDDDRRQLLELGPTLKLDDALKTLHLTEATRKRSANLKGGDASSILRMSQSTYKKNKKSNHRKKVSFDTKTDTPSPATKHGGAFKVGECFNCGSKKYHKKTDCPVAGKECHACGKTDHFSHVCRDKEKKKKSGDVRSISVHSATVSAVTVAELVDISVAPKAASSETATGSPIMNDGTLSATFNWNADDDERRPITTTVHVLQDLKQAVLSKSSQKKLGMLPESYPNARLSTLTSSAFTDVGTDSSPIPSLLFPHLLSHPMSAPMAVASLEQSITGERKAVDLKNFMTNFRVIFDGVCRPMKGSLCHFERKADATPVSMRGSRPVVFPLMQMLRDELELQERQGLIRKVTVPTAWVHSMVVVPKKCGGIQITVDFRSLNDNIIRPRFESLTPFQAVHPIPKVSPPMGITHAVDDFGRRVSDLFDDIPNTRRVVKDILIFSSSSEEHMETVRQVFARAREHGISVNPRKVVFAESSAPFGRFIVDAEGFRPDPALLIAISQFPTPLNITDLKAFFGL